MYVKSEDLFARRRRVLRVLTISIILVLSANPALALSCVLRQEIRDLTYVLSRETNVIEARINDVLVDGEKGSINFKVTTREVFKGEKISNFVLRNYSVNVAGAPNITACESGQGIHVALDRMEFGDRNFPKGLFKNENLKNALSGFPWHACGHYKNLKGKDVILLGRGTEVLCIDGIIEIEELARPSLLREFLRCHGPAVKMARDLKLSDSVRSGLPGKICFNENGTVNRTDLWEGRCSPGERRLSWLEERVGQFLTPVQLAVMMNCPNPLSVK